MGVDYNYDEQAQFWPFFVLTIAALITLPLTYNVLKVDTSVSTTPALSNATSRYHGSVQKSRSRYRRQERKLKRMLLVGLGYLIMAYMIYLIIVTARTTPKIWDPYEILGVSRVRPPFSVRNRDPDLYTNHSTFRAQTRRLLRSSTINCL